MTRVYIIQEEYRGIVNDPMVFSKEEDADKKYIELVNTNTTNNFEMLDNALDYIHEIRGNIKWDIYYYVCVIDEDLKQNGDDE